MRCWRRSARFAVSLSVAFAVWLALALVMHCGAVDALHGAALMNVVGAGVCLWLARPLRHVPMPRVARALVRPADARGAGRDAGRRRRSRFSFRIGPGGSGILAVFPVVLISIMLILHHRVGGKPTAAVLANAVLGLVGFAFACAVLHFTAEPLGVGDRPRAGAGDLDRLEPGCVSLRAPARHRRVTALSHD